MDPIDNVPNLLLRHHESLAHSAAFPVFLRSYADLVVKGWAPGGTPWTGDTQVVYMEDVARPEIVSLLAYTVNRSASMMWLLFVYTSDEYRRQGLYKRLHSYAEAQARRLNLRQLAGNIHRDNGPSLTAHRELGHDIEFIRIVKHLKKETP